MDTLWKNPERAVTLILSDSEDTAHWTVMADKIGRYKFFIGFPIVNNCLMYNNNTRNILY